MQSDSFTPDNENSRAYRDVLGRFPTGVTIVATKGPEGPMAITANSFASVSLDPPMVLWCPAKSSSRFDLFCAAEQFSIHILAEDQAHLSQDYARAGHGFPPDLWDEDATGLPRMLRFSARLTCQRAAVHDAGDHAIVIGQVLTAETQPVKPLVFAQGGYGHYRPAF